jgi:hypothetical protein
MNAARSTPRWFRTLASVVFAISLASAASSQTVAVGGNETNFTVFNHATGAPIRLSDFAGKIVVLDYFAYWCEWCAIDSPLTETDIQQYYSKLGGNAAGIPVQVLSISVDLTNPTAATSFIKNSGIEMEGDDVQSQAYPQNGSGSFPTYVVINGVAGAPGFQQWQVLYSQAGYYETDLRQVIDSVALPRVNTPLTITSQPVTQTVNAGSGVALAALASSESPLKYQWYLNGTQVAGATGPTLLMDGVQAENGGVYTVAVSDAQGNKETSIGASLTVASAAGAPVVQPATQTIAAGSTCNFSVSAGAAGSGYQWQFNGVNLKDGAGISGSEGPELLISGASSANSGDYACIVTSGGTAAQSNTAGLAVAATSVPGYLVNISARAYVGSGDAILIGGFYIVGSTSRTVLIQALGPALSGEGVSGVLQHPALTIHDSTGATIYSNTGWGSGSLLLNAAAAAYANPVLQPNSADSELLVTLPPGGYTAEISGADGGTGVALCAIYQLP